MPIMGEGAGRRDGMSAVGGIVHRIVTMHVTAGIGAGPPRVQQKALLLGVGGASSGAGGTASSGSWAGSGRGLMVGATGGINGAGGRAWDGVSMATAAGRARGNGDSECDGDRASSLGGIGGAADMTIGKGTCGMEAAGGVLTGDISRVQGSDAGGD